MARNSERANGRNGAANGDIHGAEREPVDLDPLFGPEDIQRRGLDDVGASEPPATRALHDPSLPSRVDEREARHRAIVKASLFFGLEDDPAKEDYPVLWDFMCNGRDTQGGVKKRATLTIEAINTGFAFTMRDLGLSSKVDGTCEHLDMVFDVLESMLRNPRCPWRPIGKGQVTDKAKRIEAVRKVLKDLTGDS